MQFATITTVSQLCDALSFLEKAFTTAAANVNDSFHTCALQEVRELYKVMQNLPNVEMSHKLSYYLYLVEQAKKAKRDIDWEKAENVEEELRRLAKHMGKRSKEDKEQETSKQVSVDVECLCSQLT